MNYGNYLKNKKMPKVGERVWFLKGQMSPFKVGKGKIIAVTNIDRRGLSNVYVDIEESDGNKKNYHCNIMQLFDHRPKYIEKTDEFGKTYIWENLRKLIRDMILEEFNEKL